MTEFELIKKFFNQTPRLNSTCLGIGDDCALLKPSGNQVLAFSTDTLVENIHFFKGADPEALAHKALAVNLSDLAAMGAKPLAFLLALTLPAADEAWLKKFSQGLQDAAREFNVDLIGGNTTRGPLNINITIMGEVDENKALRRDQAKTNDDIYVTGALGAAAVALQAKHLHVPTPRVAFAQDLLTIAHAAIDISDGLAQDLQHLLQASGVGADLWTDELPLFKSATLDQALNGGEDYELCFTAPVNMRNQLLKLAEQHSLKLTRIGVITDRKKLVFLDANHQPMPLAVHGYQHF
jgi:thiamine-monophosphate kinase